MIKNFSIIIFLFYTSACSCHGRASSCTFNSTLYQMTGSGGVCNNCTNHTQGIHCNECEAFYYPQLQLIDSTSYCKRKTNLHTKIYFLK